MVKRKHGSSNKRGASDELDKPQPRREKLVQKAAVTAARTKGSDAPAARPNSDTAIKKTVDDVAQASTGTFPIVGIGASAGGLEATKRLLTALPDDTGMAFVLIQHLSPDHPSHLSEILARATGMPVIEVSDEPEVRPNHVYVIPADRDMVIGKRSLHLHPRAQPARLRRPVDSFLRSLAEDQAHCAIGVILSGTGNDGSIGTEEIKAQGGITFAQDESAQHDGMPRSAIGSGCVDFVLPPERIAEELARIGSHPYVVASPRDVPRADEDVSTQILRLLRDRTRVDFTHYKSTTLFRRMSRRMLLHSLNDLSAYLAFLRQHPDEVQNLYRDILISVTSFFRDPKSFDALSAHVFPALIANRSSDDPIRVWVLGCSTGEEAYSLAIALSEHMEAERSQVPVQIFATDLNEQGIEFARLGVYPRSIAEHVSEERLRRHFIEVSAGYRIIQPIREMCVFARQNVLNDPPFSRMDMISCRNLLIYMEPVLQQRIVPLFHYALKPSGMLWLGSAETVGGFTDLFDAKDSRHRIYAKSQSKNAAPQDVLPSRFEWHNPARKQPAPQPPEDRAINGLLREADRVTLNRYAPPSVVVNQSLEVLQFRGDTSPYLAMASGRPSVNLLKLAREGLVSGLRSALQTSISRAAPTRHDGLEIKVDGRLLTVNLQVLPVPGGAGGERCFLVLFEQAGANPQAQEAALRPLPEDPTEAQKTSVRLTRELEATREYLQSLVEERDAVAEEMQSANEEIQSSNEELQSVNEELQTSKEEIQAANEELITVNDEMRGRNEELTTANTDLVNFLASTQMALVMLGRDLRIRRFTPAAEPVLNLIAADVGRSINDLRLSFDLPDLEQRLREVISDGEMQEHEVRNRVGHQYLLRLRPYRTASNVIDGALMLLIDINELKKLQFGLRASEEKNRLLMEGADGIAIILLDPEGNVDGWSNGAEYLFGYNESEIVGAPMRRFFVSEDISSGRPERMLQEAARAGPASEDCWLVRKDGSRFWASGAVTALFREDGMLRGFSKVVRDMSDRQMAEKQLEDVAHRKDVFLATLSHELRNPLAPMRNALEIMKISPDDPVVVANARETLQRQLGFMVRLIDDLMDVSRIARGKILLRREAADLGAIMRDAVEMARPSIDALGHALQVTEPDPPVHLEGDAGRLSQVFANLLQNAAKYTPAGGHIAFRATSEGEQVSVSVRDNGIGIPPEAHQQIFELFTQVNLQPGHTREGLGVGLSLVRTLVALHGGTVQAASEGPGKGAEFIVHLPTASPTEGLASEPERIEPAPQRAKRRILLVDDNPDLVDSMALLLEMLGYVTRVTRTAADCLAEVSAFMPDIVLLDIGLPDRNGYEVCRRIREMPAGSDMVIIAVTGWGKDEDKRKAAEAGFDGHLTKPVDLIDLERLFVRS